MKILVEQSGYPLANLGDISMLQVALARLSNFWPDASIKVFTCVPERLAKFCKNAQPLELSGRNIWYYPLIGRLYQLIPSQFAQNWSDLEWQLRYYSPSLVKLLMELKLKARPVETKAFESFTAAVYGADLVVASGGGYITDEFEELATTVLGILGIAQKLGKPTVMLGHGFGPLEKPKLLAKAKAILPLVNFITLREGRASIPLLNSLGVSQKRLTVTGDDAIELAYEARQPKLGDGIGINLRMAKYAGVNRQILATLGSALQEYAIAKEMPLIPVPISEYDSDAETIQKLLIGYEDNFDGDRHLDTPLMVIEQISRCRVVVTGSYHAGVFALAQGIPVVGLACSPYYLDKFLGLAAQFGVGCEIILLEGEDLGEKLKVSIDNAWNSAEIVKRSLLEASKRQIKLGHAAYQQVYDLVESLRVVS